MKGGTPDGQCKFTDVQARPTEFLDLTSLTLDAFQQQVPPFEAAFHAHMAAWRLDGKPRTARRFAVYLNCPPPDTGRSAVLHPRLPQNVCPPDRARTLIWHGP